MEKKGMPKALIGIIAGGVALVAIIAVVLILVLGGKGKSYRIIKIFEYAGQGTVTREKKGDMEPYENMILESGDRVSLESGKMTLKMDEDKYAYVSEKTEFVIEASGKPENGKTTIHLETGSVLNEIQNPLGEDAAYEVNTPNSTMSVRGTVFLVSVYEDENGVKYSRVSTFKGKVATRLILPDGTIDENEVMIEAGKEVLIYEDDTTTDFVTGVEDIDYSTLPETVLEQLAELADSGVDVGISKEELKELIEELKGPFTVKFMYNGSEFGSQIVEKDQNATIPKLQPAASGSWDFDFSTPITQDTEINWQ